MNLNELVIKNESELTEQQKEFLAVHNNILTAGSVIGNGLITLAQNLKKMKEENLFKEAGFNSFENYSEKACGLKQRQAYNYIKVLDSFDEHFLHLNAKIGITKLNLLASLDEDELEKIETKVEVSDISVSALKEEIVKLKAAKEKSESLLEEENAENERLQEQIDELEIKLDELKNKPVENKVDDSKHLEKIAMLESKIKELQNKPVKEKIVDNPKQVEEIKKLKDKLDNYNKQLEYKDELLAEVSKEKTINSSAELVEFKILFEEIQTKIIKLKTLVCKVPEEKQEGLKMALKRIGEQLC